MATNIDKFVEPAEIPGSVAVPLGGIIGWMNPNPAAMDPSPPAGFEFCDGTAVTTPGSPFLGQIKPNYMVTSAGGQKGFMRGADVTSAPYGIGTALVTGGSDTHAHTTNTSGFHSHGMKNHNHTFIHTHSTSGGDGNHTHNTGGVLQPGPGGTPSYQGGLFTHFHAIPSSGAHAHTTNNQSSNQTNGPSDNTTDGNGGHTHSVNNNTVLPVFFTEVAKIVRVI